MYNFLSSISLLLASCNEPTDKRYDPHCASDIRTYSSIGALYNAICHSKAKITWLHAGQCQGNERLKIMHHN